ncbi:MAG: EAL domain-containing protein [Gammaproteobacteria bacterium]|nr:EAL domain-containing protein [Gammaproteobacteria bacterium]
MDDTTAVPVLVHSATRDPVEALNSLLRNGGLAAHCTWIPGVQDIGDALEQLNAELLVCYMTPAAQLADVATIRDQIAPSVPLLVVRDHVDEDVMGEDARRGARDTVSFRHPDRLQIVLRRELRAFRLERTLTGTLRAAQDYRSQLDTVLQRSNDAIAQVQEGIVVDANSSWLELFGFEDATAIVGQPVMDMFAAHTHVPLKGALAACLQGRWSDHTLRADALIADGSSIPLDLVLAAGEFEGEPCVRLIVPARRRDERQLEAELGAAMRIDASTGLWTRRHLLHELQSRLATPMRGGVRFIGCIRPDRFRSIERQIGLLGGDEFLAEFAGLVNSLLGPNDLAGHFGGASLLVLIERGNPRDAEAWAESVVERIARHRFQYEDHAVQATCSVGLGVVPVASPDLGAAVFDALDGARRARDRGGNQAVSIDRADQDTRVQAYDQVWVKHIRAALMENRFRLVQQPVASLRGGADRIFDIAIRMVDTQGKEVLPAEFLPAAGRNDLLKNIDRWVIGASLAFAVRRQPDLLFVRLSRDSVADATLLPWLATQLKATGTEPQRLCLQVTEQIALQQAAQVRQLAGTLRELQVRFAIEHFGTGTDPMGLIESLPLDFVRIDGSLMQGLTGNTERQQRVRSIAEAAARCNILTVAERIEDANTMAVVWQLGVQYIQGYLVHAPEEVVLKS